ncbi:MAG: SMC-Scp complex subunit ScpB [Deltaproteobacteria bacterium]|jgi:segregation and condensation protein B
MDDIKNIIESLLFAADEPLAIDRLKKIITDADTQAIREALDELKADYEVRQGGFFLKEVADGYQIRTRPDYKEYIRRLLKPRPQRLSKAALETLAIIAYKQPVIRSDIEHIRGVDCGGVLRVLLEREFIRVLGRKDIPGRPLIYATTKRFLEVFDLKNLKDLPTPKEIEEFGSALAEEMEASDREEAADGVSTENLEETDTPSMPLEAETAIPDENRQIAIEPDEAKPDQDA